MPPTRCGRPPATPTTTHYDRWEDAFDAAVDGIRGADDDWIKDSWKDNLDGFIDFALDVLAVAGLVLAVLVLVVGGPIVALLALTVGVLTLVGTLWQYSRGDASLLDVGHRRARRHPVRGVRRVRERWVHLGHARLGGILARAGSRSATTSHGGDSLPDPAARPRG